MADFLEVMERRYACKGFDPSKKLTKEQIERILEYARLSPSSFGMEPWRFLVIENEKIKEDITPFCWNQPQISSCSHLVVIKANKAVVQDREYIEAMFARRGLDSQKTKAYIERYLNFLSNQDIGCWTAKQCYIAAANMMSGAAFDGVDSCPIEGFEPQKLHNYFNIDTKKEEIVLLIAFGICAMPRPPKKRLSVEELVQFV